MDINEPEDAADRLLKPAFGLGPFAFQAMLETKYRAELNLEGFARVIREQFLDMSLSEDLIEYLYETCLEARVEKELMAKAREITGQNSWRKSREKLGRLIAALREYQSSDFEKRLRNKLGSSEDSTTWSAASQLASQLTELNRACEWWEGFAKWERWKAFYRGYVWRMDKRLRRNYERKEQTQEIIAAAVRLMRVERRVSAASIARSLSRETAEPRRFVFRGPVNLQLANGTDSELAAFLRKWAARETTPSRVTPSRKTRPAR